MLKKQEVKYTKSTSQNTEQSFHNYCKTRISSSDTSCAILYILNGQPTDICANQLIDRS